MALEGAEWGAVAAVFVIILAMMIYNQMVAKRAATSASGASAPRAGKSSKASESDARDYLSRFVVHNGNVVGEVVAMDGEDLILKHSGQYRAVAVADVQTTSDEIHVRGELDWNLAESRGQAWLERNRKGQDDEITAQLTTSADVQRPAFEAFQSRQRIVAGDSEEE